MCQTEIDVCVSRLWICRRYEFDGWIFLFYNDLTGLCQSSLALFVIVIQLDGTKRKPV